MNIGDKFVENNFGHKLQYEVIGFDGSGRPISKFVGEVTKVADTTVETMIEELKETVKPVAKVEKTVQKKPTPKKK